MSDAEALLTPAMREVLARIRRAEMPPFHTLTPVQAREAYRLGAEMLDLPRAALPRVEDVRVPGAAGELSARLYAASTARGLPPACIAQRWRGAVARLPACARAPLPGRA
jgi:acetyl esterase